MPSINMIAPRRAEKRKLERDMRRLVAVILVELVCAIALGGWLTARLVATRGRIADLDVQLARLRPTVKQIEDYESATRKIKPKLDLLNEARERTLRWHRILDALTSSLPKPSYLTRLTTNQSTGRGESSPTVALTGITVSQAIIGEAMLRLSSVPDLVQVDLNYSQPTSVNGAPAIEFELGAKMKGEKDRKGAQTNGRVQS
ncbi:MAG: PilN domain-containing protein [Armatimonadota bacterium]|nr:PilN domain-containing protein [Armatimonadota bacterium]